MVVGGVATEVSGTAGAGAGVELGGKGGAAGDEMIAGATGDDSTGAAGDEASAADVGNTTTAADDRGLATVRTTTGAVDDIGATDDGSIGTGISGIEFVATGPAALGMVDSAVSSTADVIAVLGKFRGRSTVLVIPTGTPTTDPSPGPELMAAVVWMIVSIRGLVVES